MAEDKKQVNIRCTVEEKTMLEELANESNKSVKQYTIDLWTEEYERRQVEKDSNDKNNDSKSDSNKESNDSKADSTVISVLTSQLERKDEQIQTLQRLIDQEQQLNLAKQKEQILIEEDTKKGKWWKFWSE